MGPLALGFKLDVDQGGLEFIHQRTWLWGWALPNWLAPQAKATVKPAGERWKIDVRLSHPQLGQIVRYYGTMPPVALEQE